MRSAPWKWGLPGTQPLSCREALRAQRRQNFGKRQCREVRHRPVHTTRTAAPGSSRVTAEQRPETTGSLPQARRNPYADASATGTAGSLFRGPTAPGHGSCHSEAAGSAPLKLRPAALLPKGHTFSQGPTQTRRPQRAELASCLFTAHSHLLSSTMCEFYKFIFNFEKTEVSEKYKNNNPHHYEQLRNISF